ncbi:hypothetical protein F4805DRAFT_232994 [Annulohypoxylon moriforme]|nr:hypothetical protein F4805DRAFT_232994 [Annulohypoxylon moriforme]
MSDFKSTRSFGQILLIPNEDDEDEIFQLPPSPVDKVNFKELFTFNVHHEDQPVRDRERSIRGVMGSCILPSERISPPPETRGMRDPKHTRIIAIPGAPPLIDAYAPRLESERLDFEIPSYTRIVSPRLAYEDLCRAAEGAEKLDSIKSASFVTDVEALSALLHTVHGRVVDGEWGRDDDDDDDVEGMCFSIHSENGVTFVKTLNSSQLQGQYHYAATSHLKTNMVEPRVLIGKDFKGVKELGEFKRVVSYQFGDHPLIVEDPNHVTGKIIHEVPWNAPWNDWMSRDELREYEMGQESNRLNDDWDQYHDHNPEDPRTCPRSYSIFKTRRDDHESPLVNSRDTALFAHITYNNSKHDDITRSQLWFSGTGTILIGSIPNPEFRDDIRRSHMSSFMSNICTMHGWPGFDKWLSDRRVELSMKLVHRILTCIKHTAHDLSQQGIKKFYLKHPRKSAKFFVVSLGKEHGIMPQDLVSSYIVTRLGENEGNAGE